MMKTYTLYEIKLNKNINLKSIKKDKAMETEKQLNVEKDLESSHGIILHRMLFIFLCFCFLLSTTLIKLFFVLLFDHNNSC